MEFGRRKLARVDTLSLFNFVFVTSYLMPALIWATLPESYESKIPYKLYYNASHQPEVVVTMFLAYISFVLIYFSFKRIKLPFLLSFSEVGLGGPESASRKVLASVAVFPLVVVFNIFYVGGVGEYMAASTEARHLKTQFGVAGYLNYLLSGSLFAIISLIYLFEAKKGGGLKLLIVFSVLVLSVGLLARGGRGAIVGVFIFVCIYYYYRGKMKLDVKGCVFLSFVLFSSLFVIYFMRKISDNIMAGVNLLSGIDISLFFSALGEVLIYPFQYYSHYLFVIVEFFNDPSMYAYPRLGVDILSGLLLLIPGLSGAFLGLPELPDLISQNVMGKYNGYVPPGWIGWALMDGGMLYLAFKMCLSSLVCVFFDKSYVNFSSTSIGRLVYFLIIIFAIEFLFQATSMNLFRGSVGQFFFLSMLLFIPFLRVGRIYLIRN